MVSILRGKNDYEHEPNDERGFAGVLWGMFRLAPGSIPAAHTVSNDLLHIGMTLVTTLALVRLAWLRD